MASDAAIGDPVQLGCAAGRRARTEDDAAELEPPARPVLLMRAAVACAALADTLPGPPRHDPVIARERFVWAFVLGYEEGTGGFYNRLEGGSSIEQGIDGESAGRRQYAWSYTRPRAVPAAGAIRRGIRAVRVRKRGVGSPIPLFPSP